MEDISKGKLVKLIRGVVLLTPMSFLFHYIETSVVRNGSAFAFLGTFLFIVLAGIISVKIKANAVLIINGISILLSILLGGIFITSPNESWFNPFGMNFAIVFVGIIILIGVLTVRLLASRKFK